MLFRALSIAGRIGRQVVDYFKGKVASDILLGEPTAKTTERMRPGMRMRDMPRAIMRRFEALSERAFRTEVARAYNAEYSAGIARIAADDAQMGRMWVVDGRPCGAMCGPMFEQWEPSGVPFTLPDGTQVDGPTVHPNCMCSTVICRADWVQARQMAA